MHNYWQRQESDKPLFPDILWNKPEQRAHAGKLAIIGGNKLGFAAMHDAYKTADEAGAGQIRAVLPDVLQRTIPATVTETVYVPSNKSGGFSRDASDVFASACSWADVCLAIGDNGRNSETAMVLEDLTRSSGRLVITRDSIDLLMNSMHEIVARKETTLVVSFAQLQKIFRTIYYPKVLSFSMQLLQLVEALHKFTTTYPVTIVVFHQQQLIVSHDGQVITQSWEEPMAIWRGMTAAKLASYLLWNPKKPLEAITTSFLSISFPK